jgi:hypothetical protein
MPTFRRPLRKRYRTDEFEPTSSDNAARLIVLRNRKTQPVPLIDIRDANTEKQIFGKAQIEFRWNGRARPLIA